MNNKTKMKLFFDIFIVGLLVSCAQGAIPVEETKVEISPDITIRITTQSSTIVPTETTSPSPTMVTDTPSVETTETLTPTNQTEEVSLNQLMRTNGNCKLPCWWGIELGISKLEEIPEKFIGEGIEWWAEDNWIVNKGLTILVMLESESNDIIQSIKVVADAQDEHFVEYWEQYSLPHMLNEYGLPSQTLVYYPFRADSGGTPSFRLFLIYEELGIMINYIGKAEDLGDGKARACLNLNDLYEINLFLYQTEEYGNILETVIPAETVSFISEPETVHDLISWEQATELSLDDFSHLFSEENEELACFDFKTYWTDN